MNTQIMLFNETNQYNVELSPILKWAGGKRLLSGSILERAPSTFNRYIEPFLGGGAVLFAMRPYNSIVNDINTELINMYKTIQYHVDDVINKLNIHKQLHSLEYFYKIRSMDRDIDLYNNMSLIDRSARILYLNKTCFNGLFRVNSKGFFNVPIGGAKNPDIVNESGLRSVSTYFNESQTTFLNLDFESVIQYAMKDDFIYMDPPYDPLISQSFVTYSSDGFGRKDQIRLKNVYDKLTDIGCKVMMSNSCTDFITDLYKQYRIDIIDAHRFISGQSKGRGKIKEVLILNY